MNIEPFKASFPKVDLITSPKSFFGNIKYQFREYRKSGFYKDAAKDGFYIYQIENDFGRHIGLICSTSVKDLQSHQVMMHEKTLASKEQQMMHLLLQRKALVKPVLLGYNPIDNIQSLLKSITQKKKPKVHIEFKEGKNIHSIWDITTKAQIEKIRKSFSQLTKAYIGDGHHRTTTVALLSQSKELGADAEKYNHLLTAYFPFEELNILDYNRVVDISEIMPSSEFVVRLSKYCKIEPLKSPSKPKSKHHITCYIDGQWYEMQWRKKYRKSTDNSKIVLDSALINKFIFEKILGIKDIRVDSRIKYFGGNEPLKKIMKQTNNFGTGVGLCIYPVSPSELSAIADNGETLPPKSTWFEPRIISGIIAKDL